MLIVVWWTMMKYLWWCFFDLMRDKGFKRPQLCCSSISDFAMRHNKCNIAKCILYMLYLLCGTFIQPRRWWWKLFWLKEVARFQESDFAGLIRQATCISLILSFVFLWCFHLYFSDVFICISLMLSFSFVWLWNMHFSDYTGCVSHLFISYFKRDIKGSAVHNNDMPWCILLP